jgi:hypothetical protein
LTAAEEKLFCAGAEEFAKEDKVKEDGLGPTMNFISCLGCHQYPRSGGSSPLGKNPQYEFARSYPPGHQCHSALCSARWSSHGRSFQEAP